ncbi:MAG: hypothetical protein FWE69_00530 [Clostridiales bacterium]|nr:hypothetical protein [Clostridiales bacterium]
MKKLLSLFLLLCLFLPTGTALADIIPEPCGDDFYESHRSECVSENRVYIANGADGSVKLYKSPVDARVMETVENGTKLSVLAIYAGEQGDWGAVGYQKTSWVRMTDVYVTYDAIAFEQEHGSAFVPYKGDFSFQGDFLIWEYPRAASYYSFRHIDSYYFDSYTYEDEYGLVWGYITYLEGRRGWVCLDAPNDPELTPVPTPTPPPPEHSDMQPTQNPNRYLLLCAGGLVLLLVIVSAALIWFAYGRKRKQA